MNTLVLDETALQQLVLRIGVDVLMDNLIDRTAKAFADYDPSATVIPQRTGFHYQSPTGLVEWMPLHECGESVLMKVVGYHPINPIRSGLPTIVSTMSSYDTQTGHLSAIVDATFLTALRTGAASCAASQWLARPDSEVLGLVGCGAQAVTQLHALSRRFPIREVLLHDIDASAASSLRGRLSGIVDESVVFREVSCQELATKSDIICTATSVEIGEGPVMELEQFQPHLHINAIGSDLPGKTELPREFLENSFVCPDFIPQARVEGECQQLPNDRDMVSISEVAKSSDQYDWATKQATVFDSTGWALEDWVAMKWVIEKAKEFGIGTYIAIESLSGDPRNPYQFLTDSVPPQRQTLHVTESPGSGR